MGERLGQRLRTHNLVFSLYQIRLVGILIITLFLSRLIIAVAAGIFEPTLIRLSAQGFLSTPCRFFLSALASTCWVQAIGETVES